MDVLIRKGKDKDLPEIIENWKALIRSNLAYNQTIFKLKPNYMALGRKFMKKNLRARNIAVYVAEARGHVVGYIMVSVKKNPNIYAIDKEAYIGDLFVKSNFRRKGVGTLLLKETEKWAKHKKLLQLSLNTNVKNYLAQKAYSKFGFDELNVKMVKLVVA